MKEHIDTIPLHEAFDAGDECPFCYLERLSEQRAIRYCIGPGASYMEPDFRGETDRLGFCRQHMKKLYDYGNALGNALILQTYLAGVLKELENEADAFAVPQKPSLFAKRKQEESGLLTWAKQKESTCFLCQRQEYNMKRYFHTFFVLLREEEFRQKVASSKGFCLHHFGELLALAPKEVPSAHRQWFYETALSLMQENLLRVKEDLDHFVGMFDYRQSGSDWKNSRDAVSRTMQKLRGAYPADPPYKSDT
jgi:hypothetical protein